MKKVCCNLLKKIVSLLMHLTVFTMSMLEEVGEQQEEEEQHARSTYSEGNLFSSCTFTARNVCRKSLSQGVFYIPFFVNGLSPQVVCRIYLPLNCVPWS